MNLPSALLAGGFATLALTSALAASQGLGLSRLSLPLVLGTAFTADRRRANVYGFGLHLLNGWLCGLLYALACEALHRADWWLGALLGGAQAIFILAALLPFLPSLHPRMASEHTGPSTRSQLEPPGFLALNYGRSTPVVVLLAHLLYGAVFGAFYTLAS
jgi:uncharacterized membrane protein YagU involved in acid resistance